jgi:DNA polymerase bacteriophage-type
VIGGKDLIRFFCVPRNSKEMATGAPAVFNRPEDFPEKWRQFLAGNTLDVVKEQALDARVSDLSDFEQAVWLANERANLRGLRIDRVAAEGARRVANATVAKKNAELFEITGGAVERTTQLDRLKGWLGQPGICLDADVVEEALETEKLNKVALTAVQCRALEISEEARAASPRKLDKMLLWSSIDGRARGTLNYYAARRTGRFSGAGIQTQNMKRPTFLTASGDIAPAIAAVATGDLALVESLYENVIEVVGDLIRSIITVDSGNTMPAVDLANIEARMLAAIAGEQHVLDSVRANDENPYHETKNPTGAYELYVKTAARILGKPAGAITKAERQKFGKVPTLALGYAGGEGAFLAMMSRKDRRNISSAEILKIRDAWRAEHPNIVAFWGWLEDAAVRAIDAPGSVQTSNRYPIRFQVDRSSDRLLLTLPSGRQLIYPRPRLKVGAFNQVQVQFREYDQKWPTSIYGGKFCAHVIQGSARDLLARALVQCDREGIPIILHAHDELVAECPEAEGPAVLARMKTIMCDAPAWARAIDLPIAASGDLGTRYRK